MSTGKRIVFAGLLLFAIVCIAVFMTFRYNPKEYQIEYYMSALYENDGTLKDGVIVNGEDVSDPEEIIITNPEVQVLRNKLTIGDSINAFQQAYKDESVSVVGTESSVILFHGKYGLSNYRGVEIVCTDDLNHLIKSITIREIVYK